MSGWLVDCILAHRPQTSGYEATVMPGCIFRRHQPHLKFKYKIYPQIRLTGTIGIGLEGKIRSLLAFLLQLVEALGVVLDGNFKVGILVGLVAIFLVSLDRRKAGLALLFHLVEFWLDFSHHLFDDWISRIHATGEIELLHGPGNVAVLHQLFRLVAVGGDLFVALQLGDFLLHALQVGVGRLNSKAAFQSLDAVVEVVELLVGDRQAEVPLDKVLVRLDTGASGIGHFIVLVKLLVASGHVGPVAGDVGIEGSRFLVFLDGLGKLARLEKFIALGFDGFGLWVWHGDKNVDLSKLVVGGETVGTLAVL